MIEALTGKVGSGKSLKFVTESFAHILKGGCVCTNIELDRDEIARQCWFKGHRFKDDQYIQLPMRTDPCFHNHMRQNVRGSNLKIMVGIDEAHLFFPASEYRDLKKAFLSVESFVSQSRRVGCDIVFITQAWDNVWGQLRKQALFEIKCRDIRVIQFPLIGDALGGFLGLRWTRCDAATGTALETGKTPLSKQVFKLYSTLQPYNDEMEELMKSMPVFEQANGKVGFFERILKAPPKRP